jgi:predicted dehydrogenase
MRVAILGASHWHVPLMYLPALQECGAEIVALHDPDPQAVERVAAHLSCPRYTDHRALIAAEKPDLVFAHAPHAHMTELAADLVALGQPFHMEKPMGVDWRALDAVAVKARTEGIWTSVALVSRFFGVSEALQSLRTQGRLGRVVYYTYRLFGGAPHRYPEWGVPWMLEPALAGAGPLWNFGPHVIDLFLQFTGEQVVEVECHTSHAVHNLKIEDLAVILLRTPSGATGIGEVSYTMPDGYERYLSLVTDTLHCGVSDLSRGEVLLRDGSRVAFSGNGPDEVYPAYVRDTLDRFSKGVPARATIQDMVPTLRIMDAARSSAWRGGPVKLPID